MPKTDLNDGMEFEGGGERLESEAVWQADSWCEHDAGTGCRSLREADHVEPLELEVHTVDVSWAPFGIRASNTCLPTEALFWVLADAYSSSSVTG